MSLLDYYNEEMAAGSIQYDPAQANAIKTLQSIIDDLQQPKDPPKRRWFWFSKPEPRTEVSVKGAYLWGGVGRGKTWLMDMFFEQAPIEAKKRYHYHHFMLIVHEKLRELKHEHEDPLLEVASRLAGDVDLLCIDEFHVLDIGNAMILGGLFEGLVQNDVTVVTTSNRIPDDLYKDGLQRARFLPAIDMIKKNMHVVELDNGIDYRMLTADSLEAASETNILHSDAALRERFNELAQGDYRENVMIELNHRHFPVRRIAQNIIWLGFRTVCDGPRSTSDYIELAARYPIIMLSDVPILDRDNENAARRLLDFIDELYDRRVHLIISTKHDIKSIYQGYQLKFQFERALSRLNDMQTTAYLES